MERPGDHRPGDHQEEALGQANSVFVDVQALTMDQNARVEFVCTTSSLGDQPPRFVDKSVKLTVDGITLVDSVVIKGPGIVRFWTKSDLLANIEIGNEQETFHARVERGVERADGDAWGRLYYDCAAAFRARCDWVPLWLPALASAQPDGDGQDSVYWPGKVAFVRGILGTIEDQCAAWSEFSLHELVAGVDYHYYNPELSIGLGTPPLLLMSSRQLSVYTSEVVTG